MRFYDPYQPCVRRLVGYDGGIWEIVARRFNQGIRVHYFRLEHRYGPRRTKRPAVDGVTQDEFRDLTEMEVIAVAASGVT